MSKYRIVEMNNWYYPQHRFLLLWWDFLTGDEVAERFPSHEAAKLFLAHRARYYNRKKIIHPYP